MDGAFPDMGNHLPGEMGGLWTPPLKLADGFWFGLQPKDAPATEWLYGSNCQTFTAAPGLAQRTGLFSFGSANVAVQQDLLIPPHEPGLVNRLTIANLSDTPIELTLRWLVRFDIQPAWFSLSPDGPDSAQFNPETGRVLAHDSAHLNYCAALGTSLAPSRCEISHDLWGPEQTSSLDGPSIGPNMGLLPNYRDLQGKGISTCLEFDLTLSANQSTSVDCAISGSQTGPDEANAVLDHLLTGLDMLLTTGQLRISDLQRSESSITSPRPDLDSVYAAQNICLDLLTLDIPFVGRGLVAGFPHFAWFFGCDTYYCVGGLLVAGQADTAKNNLSTLANVARQQNGRVPHEITQSGNIYNTGNTIETSQFVTAVEKVYRWTADRAFLEEMYPLCRTGIFSYMLGECDPGGTLLPNGPGLLELRTAEHGKKLDVACSLFQALNSLQYLATAYADSSTAAQCLDLAEAVRGNIERYFWVEEKQEYVWRIESDLSVHPDEPGHSYATLEMGLLDDQHADRLSQLFTKVENLPHTGPRGLIHPGTADFVMPIQNGIMALAEFRYNRVDKGLWYLERMAELNGFFMPGAIPEHAGSTACFAQAWSSAAYNWLIVQGLVRLNPDPLGNRITIQPQLPTGWNHFTVDNLTIWGRAFNIRLERQSAGIKVALTPMNHGTTIPATVVDSPRPPVSFV